MRRCSRRSGGERDPSRSLRKSDPTITCLACGELLRGGAVTCPHCGRNPFTGRPLAGRPKAPARQEPKETGFFSLGVGMLLQPIRTSEELVFFLSTRDMLVKTAVLYLSGQGLWGLHLLPGEEGSRTLLRAVGEVSLFVLFSALALVIAAGFVSLAGRVVAGSWQHLATLVAFAFLEGLLRWVTSGLLLVAAVAGVPWGLGPAVLLFVWAWVLKLLVIQGIFGYGVGVALLIDLLAGVLQAFSGMTFLRSWFV